MSSFTQISKLSHWGTENAQCLWTKHRALAHKSFKYSTSQFPTYVKFQVNKMSLSKLKPLGFNNSRHSSSIYSIVKTMTTERQVDLYLLCSSWWEGSEGTQVWQWWSNCLGWTESDKKEENDSKLGQGRQENTWAEGCGRREWMSPPGLRIWSPGRTRGNSVCQRWQQHWGKQRPLDSTGQGRETRTGL